MASIYDLKPKFQGLLRPLVVRLAGLGVTANQVTILAAALSGLTGVAILLRPGVAWILLLVPVVLFIRMGLNAVDGMLAREHKQQSRLGGLLNEVGDVLSDAALYLPFATVPGVNPRLVVIIVVLAIVGEMTGVVAIAIGATRRYEGPMGKRATVPSRSVCWRCCWGLGVAPGLWTTLLLALVALLAGFTILNRSRHALAAGGK